MSNFNYSRFGITFRWIERYSRNTMIKVLFLALAVYLFILLMNTVTASYKGIPADMQQLTLLRAIRSCGMAYFFWVIIMPEHQDQAAAHNGEDAAGNSP